jgi:hypothetical protein
MQLDKYKRKTIENGFKNSATICDGKAVELPQHGNTENGGDLNAHGRAKVRIVFGEQEQAARKRPHPVQHTPLVIGVHAANKLSDSINRVWQDLCPFFVILQGRIEKGNDINPMLLALQAQYTCLDFISLAIDKSG